MGKGRHRGRPARVFGRVVKPRIATAVVTGLFSPIGLAVASSSEPLRHEHAVREHVVARIADDGLEPAIRTAAPDEAVVWIHYARFAVRITLEREAATRVHCREPSHASEYSASSQRLRPSPRDAAGMRRAGRNTALRDAGPRIVERPLLPRLEARPERPPRSLPS